MLDEHNHILNTKEKIEHQILRENCKRKADDSISIRPSKIIRSEFMATNFEVPHSAIKSIRKSMYNKRRKNYPPFPDSLICALSQLRQMEEDDCLKFKNEKYVHAPDNLQFICITTKININILLQCEDVFVDSTFEYAPKYFLQLYTIHGLKNG
jgi:aconitase A